MNISQQIFPQMAHNNFVMSDEGSREMFDMERMSGTKWKSDRNDEEKIKPKKCITAGINKQQ